MNILKGTVTAARATTAISGGGNDSAVQTTHILLFRVDGRQAKISASSPAMMSDNDAVVLAGTEKNGAFVALAYRNETTGVTGNVGKLAPVIGMFIGFGAAAFAFIAFASPRMGVVPKLVGLVFLAIGIFSAIRFLKIKSATDLLAATPK
jgi:hypothetical protein